ncbi:hypothetical protein HMN09_00513300 [Mycena chlorophos]|uniref:FHA domain-containing protein n=1 Tax=Mycena chlorophos TaxID=658473 RepID=A0A8H6TB96_MYCCL|nr:hypothetical protein HMN09_00513300 [Mycena chlorophos]
MAESTDASVVSGVSEGDGKKISAYYSLVFPSVTFFVRTLSVTIGRRCLPHPSSPASSSAPEPTQVDVDLGAVKSVSRLHAKIEYDQDEDRFVLIVVGRNGAWVDGVWSARGSRTPLGERSQIQIATRIFHFVLPPPAPPEDSPSPSSLSSTHRIRSPSVDITSISPPSTPQSRSPPPKAVKPAPPLPDPQLSPAKKGSKKRKKIESHSAPPKPAKALPAEVPGRPAIPLQQLIQDALRDIGGKATLQEIGSWISDRHEHYKRTDEKWMSSIRFTLTTDKLFKKLEKCTDLRGKGFFWSLAESGLEPQISQSGGGKGKKKEKMTEIEMPGKTVAATTSGKTLGTVQPDAVQPSHTVAHRVLPAGPLVAASSSSPAVRPAAGLSSAAGPSTIPPPNTYWTSTAVAGPAPKPAVVSSTLAAPPATNQTDVSIPIILGPIPPTHPDYSPSHPNNSAKEGYMVLHERTLILDPSVFSGLGAETLKDLEKMGARKALTVLAGHMVRILKERRAARSRGRGRGRGRGRRTA